MRDQSVAETSIWQRITLTRVRHPCLWGDSAPTLRSRNHRNRLLYGPQKWKMFHSYSLLNIDICITAYRICSCCTSRGWKGKFLRDTENRMQFLILRTEIKTYQAFSFYESMVEKHSIQEIPSTRCIRTCNYKQYEENGLNYRAWNFLWMRSSMFASADVRLFQTGEAYTKV
jgi:hypothetical protein